MAKKYKVKMTESELERFKAFLKENKKVTKKEVIKEAGDILANDEDFEEGSDDDTFDDDDDEEMSLDEIWDRLIEEGIATNEEIELVTNINGYNEDSLMDILYARTGFRNFEQLENN